MKTLKYAACLVLRVSSVTSVAPVGGLGDKPMMDVLLPAPIVECKCQTHLTFSPTDGAILCPNTSNTIAMQIVWQDTEPTSGNCTVVPPPPEGQPGCQTLVGSTCAADFPPLTVTLFNCWAGGKWITATGLQGGQRFWHGNDDGVEFDPDLSATCRVGAGSTTDKYEIKVWPAQLGGNQEGAFSITLTCDSCSIVN